jgi:hypothetical protein
LNKFFLNLKSANFIWFWYLDMSLHFLVVGSAPVWGRFLKQWSWGVAPSPT